MFIPSRFLMGCGWASGLAVRHRGRSPIGEGYLSVSKLPWFPASQRTSSPTFQAKLGGSTENKTRYIGSVFLLGTLWTAGSYFCATNDTDFVSEKEPQQPVPVSK